MLAAKTTVPVLGVPVPSRHLQGQDSLLSIVQMPAGVPVATFAIGDAGATNAGLFAVALLANDDPALRAALDAYRVGAARAGRRIRSRRRRRREPSRFGDRPAGDDRDVGRWSARPLCRDRRPPRRLSNHRPRPRPRGAGWGRCRPAPRGRLRRRRGPRRAGVALRGRHHGVREPTGRGVAPSRPRRRRRPTGPGRGDRPGPPRREVVPRGRRFPVGPSVAADRRCRPRRRWRTRRCR